MIIYSITVTVLAAVISAIVTTKIVAAHYFKIVNGFLENYDKQIMDLIEWAKEQDKHR